MSTLSFTPPPLLLPPSVMVRNMLAWGRTEAVAVMRLLGLFVAASTPFHLVGVVGMAAALEVGALSSPWIWPGSMRSG